MARSKDTLVNFERALEHLCDLCEASGYSNGRAGTVRSLAHHRWPFDREQQLVGTIRKRKGGPR